MTELRDTYFATLGIDPDKDCKKVAAALERAYKLRSFEIEHYWKRATYFWGFQVAIFAALGWLWKDSASAGGSNVVTVALAGLGVLTAFAHTISSQGSKFWQNNWENHIDMLEDSIEGRLHKTVWLLDGNVSFSVSRVNSILTKCFIGFWVLTVVYVGWSYIGSPTLEGTAGNMAHYPIIAMFVLLIIFCLWQMARQKTKLECKTVPQPFILRPSPSDGPKKDANMPVS